MFNIILFMESSQQPRRSRSKIKIGQRENKLSMTIVGRPDDNIGKVSYDLRSVINTTYIDVGRSLPLTTVLTKQHNLARSRFNLYRSY